MKPTFIHLPLVTLFLFTVSNRALATTHVENPEAGNTAASAQILPLGVTEITGTLEVGLTHAFSFLPVDVDVYCLTLPKAVKGAVIKVISPNGDFDPNLLLLNAGFFGIWGDDNSGGGQNNQDSQITIDLPAGTYYIAVGDDDIAAFGPNIDDPDDYAWNNDSNQLSPADAAKPIAILGAQSGPNPTGGQAYKVTLHLPIHPNEILKESLNGDIKKLKKKIKRAKKQQKLALVKKLKKKLKKLQKKLKAL